MKSLRQGLRHIQVKNFLFGLAAFLIPAGVMLVIYILKGFAPFGESSLLTSDMIGQYSAFLAYFKDMWKNGNDFFYTFSKALGGDMLGFSAYYLFSPLNWVTLFFPTDKIAWAVMLITLLKTGCAGLTFYLFVRHIVRLKSVPALIFSTGYALMGYAFMYQFTVIWLDALIFLPLTVWGLHRLMENGKFTLYVLSLAGCLAVNYYTGFMICLFLCLYAAYLLTRPPKSGWPVSAMSGEKPWRRTVAAAGRFVGGSLLSAALAAVILLPTALSLIGGIKQSNLGGLFSWEQYSTLPEMLAKTYTATFQNSDLMNVQQPPLFFGILSVGMMILYFLNGDIHLKEKIAAGAVTAVLLISCQFKGPFLLFHAFNWPIGMPYRHAFVIGFWAAALSARCFAHIGGLTLKKTVGALAIYAGMTVVIAQMHFEYTEGWRLWVDLALMAAFACCLTGLLSKSLRPFLKQALIVAILVLHVGNMAVNGKYVLDNIQYDDESVQSSYVDKVEPVIDAVKAMDSEFYRMEINFSYERNDPFLFSYRGLTSWSSTEKVDKVRFLHSLGIHDYADRYNRYNTGSTIAVDGLLGVRYLLATRQPNRIYRPVFTQNGVTVYRNPYALPIAFPCRAEIGNVSSDGDNPFEWQNRMFEAMGVNPLFTEADAVLSLDGLERDPKETALYRKTGEGAAVFTLTAESGDPLYMYLPSKDAKPASLRVNGKTMPDYFTFYYYQVVCLGSFRPGETVTVTLTAKEKELNFSDAYFYYEDMQATEKAFSDLSANPCLFTAKSSSHLTGTVTIGSGQGRLLTTIPADEGWTFRIDGKKVTPVKTFGAVWSVPVSAGEHTVEMRYVPKGFLCGAIVTLWAAAALIILNFPSKRIRRKTKPNKLSGENPPKSGAVPPQNKSEGV